jgi:hypothetical protein
VRLLPPVVVQGMLGLGDCVYQRPILRAMQRLYGRIELSTPWPQFARGLGIRTYPLHSSIRCCEKNLARSRCDNGHATAPLINLRYDPPDLHKGISVYASMERIVGVRLRTIVPDLPDFGPPVVKGDYIVVRPATRREDWISYSRNPRPEYLVQACEWARDEGWRLVMVADIQPGYEDAVLPLPAVDQAWVRGELRTEDLMALVAGARGVIAPIGWVVPVCLSYQVPLLAIVGGQLLNNNPSVLTDPRLIWNGITWAMPDRPCYCGEVTHECDREITDLRTPFEKFSDLVRAGEPRGSYLAA